MGHQTEENPVNQSNISQVSEPTLRLRNGRIVGFLQVGKADGPVVFHFHGHGSSRLEALLVSEQAVSLGVRLIAVDRPGIGRSSANEGIGSSIGPMTYQRSPIN